MVRLITVWVGTLALLMILMTTGWSSAGTAHEPEPASLPSEAGRATPNRIDSFVLHDEMYQIDWEVGSIRISTTGNLRSWNQIVAPALEACRWFARSAGAAAQSGNEPAEVAGHAVILDDFLGAFDFQMDNTGGRWFSLFSVDAGHMGFTDGIGPDCGLVDPHVDVRRSGAGPYDYTAEITTGFSSGESPEHEGSGGDIDGFRPSEAGTFSGIDIRGDAKLRVQESGCRPWVTRADLHDVSFWSGATHIRLKGAVEFDAAGILSGSINANLNVDRSFVEFVENSGIFDDPVTARIVGAILEAGSGEYEFRCSEGRCRVYGIIVPFLPIGNAPRLPRTC